MLITQDEAWRRGHDGAAEGDGGRGDGRVPVGAVVRRPAADRRRRADARRGATTGGTTWRPTRPTCPCEPMDSRGPALSALHVRHDREAEGDRAHDRRLPRRRRRDAPLHLRHQARDGLLVRGRRRLGDRATPTSSTGRSATGRPASCTRGRRTTRTRTAGGRSSSGTGSTSSTRRRPRSAPT